MTAHRNRSPLAKALLAALGGLFIAAGVVLSVWLMVQTWGYASKLELALGLVLLASAAFGGYLIAMVTGVDLLHRRRTH